MIATALVFCVTFAQARVDVREPAAIGSVMVQRLAKDFGVTMRAADSIKDEPLIFSVKGVTFDEFREVSARGLDASWRQVGELWELYRSPEQVKAEEAKFLEWRKSQLKKRFEELEDTVQWYSDDKLVELAQHIRLGNADQYRYGYFGDDEDPDDFFFPGDNALTPVIKGLGADFVANAPIGSRYVFSSDGVGKTKRLATLAALQKSVIDHYKHVEQVLKDNKAWNTLETSAGGFVLTDLYDVVGAAPVERMVFEMRVDAEEVSFSVSGFDKKGNSLVSYSDWMWTDWDAECHAADGLGERQVRLSDESIELSNLLWGSSEEGDEQKVYDTLLDLFSKMPEKELLGLDASDILFTLAEAAGKPLAGRLSDDLLEDMPLFAMEDRESIANKSIPLRAGLDWLAHNHRIEAVDGELRVAPNRPQSFQAYIPRQALSDYVRRNRGKPLLDLANLPSLYSKEPNRPDSDLVGVAMLSHGSMDTMWDIDTDLVVAWQSLPASIVQQSYMPGGTVVRPGLSSARLQKWISGKAHEGRWTGMLYDSGRENEPDYDLVYGSLSDTILFDVLPSTFDDFPVKFEAKRVRAVYLSQEGSTSLVSPGDLAYYTWSMERRKEKTDDFVLELRDSITVVLTCTTPIGVRTQTTTIPASASGSAVASIDQLPADFLAEYRKKLAELRAGGGALPR